jgi:hypothetical protein
MQSFKNWLKTVLLYPEKSPLNPVLFFLTFLAVVNLGTFLEVFSGAPQVPFQLFPLDNYLFLPQSASIATWYLRSMAWWLTAMLGVIITIRLASNETTSKVSRFVAGLGWIAIAIPACDLILSGGNGFHSNYTGPRTGFLAAFPPGSTDPGKILAIITTLFCLIAYLKLKNCPLKKIVLASITTIAFFIFLGAVPLLIKWAFTISKIRFTPSVMPLLLIRIFFIFIWLEAVILAHLTDKQFLPSLSKKIAWEKLLPVFFLFILGVVLYRHAFFTYAWENALSFSLAVVVIINGWLITRFLKTYAADNMPTNLYSAGALFAFTAFCALAINFIALYFFVVVICLAIITWLKPWQACRMGIAHRLVNAFQAFIVLCAGWHFSGQNMLAIPKPFFLAFLLLPALFLNCLDLNELSKKGNLIFFLGLDPAKTFCAIAIFAAITGLPFIMLDPWLLVLLLPGAGIGAYLCYQNKFSPRRMCYLFSSVLLATIIWLSTF